MKTIKLSEVGSNWSAPSEEPREYEYSFFADNTEKCKACGCSLSGDDLKVSNYPYCIECRGEMNEELAIELSDEDIERMSK